MRQEELDWVRQIAKTLDDKKAFNIIAFDLGGCSSITDCVIVAEAEVSVHARALMREVERVAKSAGKQLIHVDGLPECEWIVMDFFSVMVHIMTTEMRHRYSLEGIWSEGQSIDLRLLHPEKRQSM
ncbi:MAG: ribosome silencing factor [Chlamydiia bacterium]|nr:ribosome silencing factor [Chlamydiia bacterium]